MNPTSRAILQTVLTSDAALSEPERDVMRRLLSGVVESVASPTHASNEPLLVTQKVAAKMLSVDRVTVWRMTRDGMLHPVEILPGTWRYLWTELGELAKTGWRRTEGVSRVESAA